MGNDDPTVETTAAASTVGGDGGGSERATFGPSPDRFATKTELGRGGMGLVVAADDTALGREVAIKRALSTRPADLRRFEREVRITAQLEHPSIVPLYEAGRDPAGHPYYVMRKIAGSPLSDRLAEPLDARLALLPSLLAVVDAAAFAHARGILHRDIKPSNILLGDFGESLLIDWGIARRLDEDEPAHEPAPDTSGPLTRAGDVVGTVAYMAPEQARGELVDARADVYALGATLFHLLAGRAPHGSSSLAERAVGDAPPPDFRALASVPPDLVAIVRKAMEPEPAARYRDAGLLAKDLRAFLAGQLVAAHAYTTWERLRRVLRRHRLAVAISLGALVALAVVSAVALSQIISSRDDAERGAALAELRAELTEIERATALVPIAPSHAAALLLALDPGAFAPGQPNAAKLRDLIASLAWYGLARGDGAHQRQIVALAFSPDERHVAVADLGGMIAIHELPTARPVPVFRGVVAHHLLWASRRTLLAWSTDGISAIDLETGKRTMLFEGALRNAINGGLWLDPTGTRVRFVDTSGERILEVPLTGGPPVTLASSVNRVRRAGDVIVAVDEQGVRVLGRDGSERVIDAEEPSGLALSGDGELVALVFKDRVVERRVRDGAMSMEWRIPFCSSPIYAESRLYVTTPGMQLVSLVRAASAIVPVSHVGGIRNPASWARGAVWPLLDGGLLVDSNGARVRLSAALERPYAHAVSPSGRTLVVGGFEGGLRWVDLETTIPDHLAGVRGKSCGITSSRAFILEGTSLHELDLRTRRRRVVSDSLSLGTVCPGIAGDASVLVYDLMTEQFRHIDVRSGRSVALGAEVRFDSETSSAWVLRGRRLTRLDLDTGIEDPRQREAPRDGLSLVYAGHGHVLFRDADQIVRLHLDDEHVDHAFVPGATIVATDFDGTSWIAAGTGLFAWTSSPPIRLHVFGRNIRHLWPRAGGLELDLDDGTAWHVSSHEALPRTATSSNDRMIDASGRIVQRDVAGKIEMEYPNGLRVTLALDLVVDVVASQENEILALSTDGNLWRLTDVVPTVPLLARTWLERATNARIGAHGQLEWRTTDERHGTNAP